MQMPHQPVDRMHNRHFPLWLVSGALLLGITIGWLIHEVCLAPFGPIEHGASGAEGTKGTNARGARDRDVTSGWHQGTPISEMDSGGLLDRLVELNNAANDPARSPREMHAAMYRMHMLVQNMRREEVAGVLSGMMRRPALDPKTWTFASGLAEMLLERLMDTDADAAISWAKSNGSLSMIAGILSRRNPYEAAAFLRKQGLKIQEQPSIAGFNIGRYAMDLGPDDLLSFEDVLGEAGIDQALQSIPPGQCEKFAERWLERMESGLNDNRLRTVLERWGTVNPQKMILWYHDHPNLAKDVQFVSGLMSTLLDKHEEVGLDFAEVEFKRSPQQGRRLFTIAVNSNHDPEVWIKLAARLPDDAKPTVNEFPEHLRIGRAPDPKGIVMAAECISDPEQRFNYLKRVLTNSKDWASKERGWSEECIQESRKKLEVSRLDAPQRNEMLDLFDRVAADALSRNPQ